MACETFVKEFQSENLSLHHENPSDFLRSQWPINQKLYVGCRIIVSLALIGWFLADIIYESETFYQDRTWTYAVYATNWSFFLLVITSVYQTVCSLVYTAKSSDNLDDRYFDRMPLSLKILWVLKNMSYNSAFIVTMSYWAFIIFLDHSKIFQTELSRLKHTLNSVYVISDVMISATPFRLLHMFYTVVLGSIYSLFNAIYFLNDGTILEGRHYAYNVLNWVKPTEAIVTCILCIVLAILSQTFLFLLYRLRLLIFSKVYFKEPALAPLDDFESEMSSIISDQPNYTLE
ncbi:protein rolling stone-like isoform X2 [Crassostrea angulata]|uniref:protein rolling stone-like isoform X2 n=1 Tax=Magallana angulata TaxID=2784310 RepID=UPI00148A12C7|nr:protein rolling stone isoform X2 [Crassostrea gigas]XP_052679430.1 protein rolling stone-like isoform X2 [Crassostrea angulata]